MTKKLFLFLFVFLLIPIVCSCSYAWWVKIAFIPDSSEVEKIPISEIDKSWINVKVLSIDAIPREALESDPYDPINKFGYVFSHVGDFNNDAIEDKAIVGVYEDKSGEFGRFLLIMTRINNKWKKSFVSIIPGKPGFSILWPKGGILIWSLCMECGSHGELIWNGKEYEVNWINEDYED